MVSTRPMANKTQTHSEQILGPQQQIHKSPLKNVESMSLLVRFHLSPEQKSTNPPPTHISKKISTIQPPFPTNPPLKPTVCHQSKPTPPTMGLWKIKHCLRRQGKREVEKFYGEEIWCAIERKSKYGVPWRGFLNRSLWRGNRSQRGTRQSVMNNESIFLISSILWYSAGKK